MAKVRAETLTRIMEGKSTTEEEVWELGKGGNSRQTPGIVAPVCSGPRAGRPLSFTLGRHIDLKDRWFGDLFLSIGQAFGAPLQTFGEHGTQPISELKV